MPLRISQRWYEQASRVIPASVRPGAARLAGALGLFTGYRDRIQTWQGGNRPTPVGNPRFRTSQVAAEWRRLFGE